MPAFGTFADLNAQLLVPFGHREFRYQQVWDGPAVARQGATLTGIGFRRDTQDNSTYVGQRLQSLVVRIGHTSVGPTTMSTTFATNTPASMTTVWRGPYDMPTLRPASGLPPVAIRFPFQSAYQYQTSVGNLIVDLTATGSQLPQRVYPIDAAYVGANGRIHRFGVAGRYPDGTSPLLDSPTALSQIVPGGRVVVRVGEIPSAQHRTWINFSLSTQYWSGGQLPFDLAPLGAPGNTVYASLNALTPGLTPRPVGGSYAAEVTVPIPSLTVLRGKSFYCQAIQNVAGANPLDLLMTGGMHVTVGGMTGSSVTQMMGDTRASSTRGAFVFPGATGGPVVEFSGTFR